MWKYLTKTNISMHPLTLNCTPNDSGATVCISGSLISINAIDLKTELHKFINKRQKLIVDITNVTDIDLTGLNALMFTKIKCSLKYSDMVLVVSDEHPIMKLIRITRSEGQFKMQRPIIVA
jgi:anti-anti-sigma regulatory factor